MLRSLALVCLLGTLARAEPDPPASSPPSKTLERSIKLYDKRDFVSASIELQKVLDGESGDDVGNKQRAQFFMGKTLYQLGYYAAAAATFDRIVQQGSSHRYYEATQKWLVGLVAFLPEQATHAIVQYAATAADDPSLASVRGDLLYRRGLSHLSDNDFGTAAKDFTAVPRDSKVWRDAQAGLGIAEMRAGRDAEALAAFAIAGTDVASLAAGQLHIRAKAWDKALAALGTVKTPAAQWEASWARLGKAGRAAPFEPHLRAIEPTILGPDRVEPAVLPVLLAFETCGRAAAHADGLVGFRKDAVKLRAELAAITKSDDNQDFYERHARALRDGTAKELSPRGRALARAVLAGPAVTAALAQVDELSREQAALNHADRAWLTTRVAADVLQTTTIQLAVAIGVAGSEARDRLLRLDSTLEALASAPAVPVGPDGFAVACP